MSDDPRRAVVTLSKAHRSTPAGLELIALLADLSDDGQVTREEMERLKAWLEVDRGVAFPGCAFLYEVVDRIGGDGVVTEEELDSLARAIERVLPSDVRLAAAAKRKEQRAARRITENTRRVAAKVQDRARRQQARERAKPLHRVRFVVRGALRSAERREGCERLAEGDNVTLERERDNRHDNNAILVLANDDTELGYVPREDASQMAPLLDGGAAIEATVQKLWATPDGGVVPIVQATLRPIASSAAVLPPPLSRPLAPNLATPSRGLGDRGEPSASAVSANSRPETVRHHGQALQPPPTETRSTALALVVGVALLAVVVVAGYCGR